MRLFHYTSTHHLPRILRDGFLRPTESNVGTPAGTPTRLAPVGEHVGPDVVWLLDTDDVTFDHGIRTEVNRFDKTAVRFTVEVPSPTRWTSWVHARRMHPRWRAAMIHSAGGKRAVRHWWITEQPIPADAWLALHVRQDDGTWELLIPNTTATEETVR